MKSIIKLQSIGILLFSMFFMMNCSDDNHTPTIPDPDINMEEAKLSDFPLFGIERVAIDITQPVIEDNKEITYGEIKITVPSITSLDNIGVSITSKELNLSKFSMSPDNVSLSFEDDQVHVFTISEATGEQEALLHYNVSIIKEAPSVPETLKITRFTFEKSKNPSLPNDIMISKTVEDPGSIDKIYIFVPLGTDFTDLVPTITYDGTKLYYTQDTSVAPVNMDVEYPTVDTSFDFKYPKSFILAVKDRDDDDIRTTNVIVDVINPVRIETVSVTTPDATEGSSEYFTGVTKWINQGNHKINFQKATTYEDRSPVVTPPTNVITVDRSLPGGGLIPGESANVNVRVSQYFPEGTYKTTAVFYTRIFQDYDSDDLFEPSKVTVTSNIVN